MFEYASIMCIVRLVFFFFQAEDGIRDLVRSRGLGDVYKRQSRHLAGRGQGSTPWTLLDYFPDDWLLFIDESHISVSYTHLTLPTSDLV